MTLPAEASSPPSPISPLALVGVCAAGKTTVSAILTRRGLMAKPVAQEHSGVPDLHRRTGSSVILLCASWQTVHRRRALAWDQDFYRVEWERLRHARENASLTIHTDWIDADAVADVIEDWFYRQRVAVD